MGLPDRLTELRARAAGVLLVGHDGQWRAGLAGYLGGHGLQPRTAADAREAAARLGGVDLVVLEAEGGLDLCRRLSAEDGPPVILVSDRAEDVDRSVGLEVGADDFIAKSCSQRELLARIRAVLRRRGRGQGAPPEPAAPPAAEPAPVRFAGWTLWPWKLEVESPKGERSVLTASDFKLLSILLEHPGEAVTRERLSGLLPPAARLRSLDTSISRLRRKLGRAPSGEPLIRTLHGVGYMLNCTVHRGAAASVG